MSINTADIQKAIVSAWSSSGLDAVFRALWSDPLPTDYVTLNDQEASPGQAFPYCVINQMSSTTTDKMSGGADKLQEVRDIPVTFNVYTRPIAGDSRSIKELAAYLAEEITKVFGGHPTVAPQATLTLDNGSMLPTRYQTDYGIRIDDNEYQWVVSYLMRSDVPVMT